VCPREQITVPTEILKPLPEASFLHRLLMILSPSPQTPTE
jgi:hypothetical protein